LINKGPITLNLTTGQPSEILGWNASVFFAEKILMPPLKPLSEQETTPHSLEGFAADAHTCQDAPCQNVNQLARALAFGPNEQPLLESQHNTDAWRAALQATLAPWKPGNRQWAGRRSVSRKDLVYNNLYAMSPGASRESVLRSWLSYIETSRATVSDRAQWFLPVNALIGRVALDPGNTKLEILRQQDDPVIALYVQLEPLAPRGPEKVLPLL